MGSNWKAKASFLAPTYEVSLVQNESVRFYSISVGMAFKLRNAGKSLAKALALLFTDTKKDAGSVYRKFEGDSIGFESINDPITEKMAVLRSNQQSQAVQDVVDALTDPENVTLIGEIILSSLRDTFKDSDDRPTAQEFMAELPLPVLTDMLLGVAKANKRVLGPLGQTLSDLWPEVQALIQKRLKPEYAVELSPTPTPGQPSKIESSASSSEGMASNS